MVQAGQLPTLVQQGGSRSALQVPCTHVPVHLHVKQDEDQDLEMPCQAQGRSVRVQACSTKQSGAEQDAGSLPRVTHICPALKNCRMERVETGRMERLEHAIWNVLRKAV